MAEILAEIEAIARRLPAAERERLAQRLFESVHNQELTDVDLAWLAVAEERFAAYAEGRAQGIPASQFLTQVREELGWK